MEDLIKQITESICRYQGVTDKKIRIPDEKDVSEMFETVKSLIYIKDQEISALNKMLCISAHSFTDFKTFELIDAALDQAKSEYNQLEELKTSLRSIII